MILAGSIVLGSGTVKPRSLHAAGRPRFARDDRVARPRPYEKKEWV